LFRRGIRELAFEIASDHLPGVAASAATPKSMSLASSVGQNKCCPAKYGDWTTPRACAAANPAATRRISVRTYTVLMGPSGSTSSSEGPSTDSINSKTGLPR
jgi:hypothetical protein